MLGAQLPKSKVEVIFWHWFNLHEFVCLSHPGLSGSCDEFGFETGIEGWGSEAEVEYKGGIMTSSK